jgi:hypothetical protein
MSANARLEEIGRILAAGVVRLNAAQSRALSAEDGKRFVDFALRKSGGYRTEHLPLGEPHEASQ